MTTPKELPQTTRRQALGQIVLCQGCCCGRTDRGFPAVPVEHFKAAWKAEKFNRVVQLTISGCLGPCDLANVVLVMTPEGNQWLGGLVEADYDVLLAWVRDCARVEAMLPLPPALSAHHFRRFLPTVEMQAC